MSNLTIAPVSYGGWPNCYRLANDQIELIVTADVGPRIIHCGFLGGRNLFATFEDQLGKSGEPYWTMRGGHRLWVAPEVIPDTYALDNSPVTPTLQEDGITLLQPIEAETGLRKEISVQMRDGCDVKVTHRIENTGPATRRLAAWPLTQMASGGVAIATFPARGKHEDHLQPTHPLVMWAYTDFSDPRWSFTKKYLILRSDPVKHSPQKAGLFNTNTFAVYVLGKELFAKRTEASMEAPYPDYQCSFEVFTNSDCLELETLSPLVDLLPDNSVAHVEHWSLHRVRELNSLQEDDLDDLLTPILRHHG